MVREGTTAFYRRWLGASVVADTTLGGVRKVLLQVGSGRLSFYDQPPNRRGPINHLGIRVEDLPTVVAAMRAGGIALPGGVKNAESFHYAMVEGPDGVLLELFEFDRERTPAELRAYYEVA